MSDWGPGRPGCTNAPSLPGVRWTSPRPPQTEELERLRAELSLRGLRSEVITTGCKPRLRINIPGARGGFSDAEFEDNVVVAAGRYMWPWVEEICAAADPANAAKIIITTFGLDVSERDQHGEVPADGGHLDHRSGGKWAVNGRGAGPLVTAAATDADLHRWARMRPMRAVV